LIKLVGQKTLHISENPFMSKRADFSDTRVISIRNFMLFYKITDKSIIITAFWDNRQNPKKLIELLQNK